MNTGNLAIALFVSLAVLSTIRGKETETTTVAAAKPTTAEVAIDNFGFSPANAHAAGWRSSHLDQPR